MKQGYHHCIDADELNFQNHLWLCPRCTYISLAMSGVSYWALNITNNRVTRSRGLSSGCDQAWPCVASHNWQPGESITEEVFKRKFRNSFWFFSSVLFPYHLLSSKITIWQCTNFYTMSCNVAANLFECLCVPLLSHKLLVNIVGHTPPFYIYKVTFLNVSHTSQC